MPRAPRAPTSARTTPKPDKRKRQQQEEPAAPAVTARAGRHGTAVYASADANRAAAERGRPKVAAMQGRTMYRRLDGSLRPKNVSPSVERLVVPTHAWGGGDSAPDTPTHSLLTHRPSTPWPTSSWPPSQWTSATRSGGRRGECLAWRERGGGGHLILIKPIISSPTLSSPLLLSVSLQQQRPALARRVPAAPGWGWPARPRGAPLTRAGCRAKTFIVCSHTHSSHPLLQPQHRPARRMRCQHQTLLHLQ